MSKSFAAKFSGTCSKCLKPIHVGEPIAWNRKRRGVVYHAVCANGGVYQNYNIQENGNVIAEHSTIAELKEELKDMENEIGLEEFTPYQAEVKTVKTVQNGHSNANGDLAAMLANAIKSYLPENEAKLDENRVREIVQGELQNIGSQPVRFEVKTPESAEFKDLGVQHHMFGDMLTVLSTRTNVWLTGPAGSGKTTAAHNCAKALDLKFYFCGAQSNEYGLLGFTDANGRTVRTPFREAYENGGVFLFDEVDASAPSAVLAFNAALANGVCAFPDGIVDRHADFVCIAAANTFGLGASNDYVGRMKQDAAFIDRFVQIDWDIDASLEVAISGNATWAKRVQYLRKNAATKGIKVIISPRASINGAKLIAAGMDITKVERVTVRKGMTEVQWNSIQ